MPPGGKVTKKFSNIIEILMKTMSKTLQIYISRKNPGCRYDTGDIRINKDSGSASGRRFRMKLAVYIVYFALQVGTITDIQQHFLAGGGYGGGIPVAELLANLG